MHIANPKETVMQIAKCKGTLPVLYHKSNPIQLINQSLNKKTKNQILKIKSNRF